MVSIIIPTYNRSGLILRAINSVLQQTYQDWELLVVDDGSTDNTSEVLKQFSEDPRIRYFKKKNSGAADSRNYGVKLTNGKYLMFLDSDDTWEPEKLEKNVEYLKNYSGDVCLYSGFRILDADKNNVIRTDLPGDVIDMHEALKKYNPIHAFSTVVIPKKIFEEVGGFDTGFRARQDVDLYYRISKKYNFVPIPEVLVNIYSDSPDRISADNSNRLAGFERYLNKHRNELNFDQKSFLAKRIVVLAIQNKSYHKALQYGPLGISSFISSMFKKATLK